MKGRSIFARVARGNRLKNKKPSVSARPLHKTAELQESSLNLINQVFRIIINRFLEQFDEAVALTLAVCSLALVYWVTKKVLVFSGIEEHSLKFKVIVALVMFVESGVLVLKLFWDNRRR
jgi:hypothetical protein